MTANSITLASSIAPRLRHLARRIHSLGEAPLFHLLAECVALSSAAFDRIEVFAALDRYDAFIRANNGRDLPPHLWVAK
jgi:hypothetical protein